MVHKIARPEAIGIPYQKKTPLNKGEMTGKKVVVMDKSKEGMSLREKIKLLGEGLSLAFDKFVHNVNKLLSSDYGKKARINRANYNEYHAFVKNLKIDFCELGEGTKSHFEQRLTHTQKLAEELSAKATGPNLKRDIYQLLASIRNLRTKFLEFEVGLEYQLKSQGIQATVVIQENLRDLDPILQKALSPAKPLNEVGVSKDNKLIADAKVSGSKKEEFGEALAQAQTIRRTRAEVKKMVIPDGFEDKLIKGKQRQERLAAEAKVKVEAEAQALRDQRTEKKLAVFGKKLKDLQTKTEAFQLQTPHLADELVPLLEKLKVSLKKLQVEVRPDTKDRIEKMTRDLELLEIELRRKVDRANEFAAKPTGSQSKKAIAYQAAGELFLIIVDKTKNVVVPSLSKWRSRANQFTWGVAGRFLGESGSADNQKLNSIASLAGNSTAAKFDDSFGKRLEEGLNLIKKAYNQTETDLPKDVARQMSQLRQMLKTLASTH